MVSLGKQIQSFAEKQHERGVTLQSLCLSTGLGMMVWSIAHLPQAWDGPSGRRLFYALLLQGESKNILVSVMLSFPLCTA